MSAPKRSDNRDVALVLQNTLGTNVLYPTAVALTDSVAQHVAIVNGSGDQMTSFGIGDVAAGSADSGNPVKIGGFGSTTAPSAVTAGQRVNAWLDLNGRQATFLAYLGAFISTNATTNVKSGAGVIHTVTFENQSDWDNNALCTIYDNTAASGTKIADFNLDNGVGPYNNTFTLDILFTTGLTVVTAGPTTPAKITISYL